MTDFRKTVACVYTVVSLLFLTSCGGGKTADQRVQDTSQRVTQYQRAHNNANGGYISPRDQRMQHNSRSGYSRTGSGPRMFETESSAARYCGRQDVVWLNTSSGVYHLQGDRSYGNTRSGGFTCRRLADEAGDRPSGER